MAVSKLQLFKPTTYWKLMPELAELAKRECLYHEAKCFYKIAIALQPFCPDVRINCLLRESLLICCYLVISFLDMVGVFQDGGGLRESREIEGNLAECLSILQDE